MDGDRVRCWRVADVLGGVEVLRADVRRSFPRHFHDDYTVGLVTRGANRFAYRRDRLVAPAGTLCLADPGEVHTGEADERGWSYWTVHVAPAALAGLRAELDDRASAPPDFASGVIGDARAVRLVAGFFRTLHGAGPLERESRAVAALGHLIRAHSAQSPRPLPVGPDAGVALRVRDHLADRLAEAVTLAELETATGVGRFRLLRAFRRTYGLPPHAWQMQARLARAHALIAAGSAIADAAADAGFADQAHLTRLFKRSYGYTPGVLARGR
ncbi:AraC family ligand binding domain-containing protein [Azospirillum sp.]|uniref:AraC family ligand binding domain-containing protein n=1 Tax=Azospirillum sp. TaxID=34012 RepID=UPI003D73F1B5